MTVSYDSILKNHSEMASSIKKVVSVKKEVSQAVAALDFSVDGDFYMATFRGGKVQKVNSTKGGQPLRLKRVLDFDSKVEVEKEKALALKRKQLGSGIEFKVGTGKKEKTLAEVLVEMKKRKSGGALATVQRDHLPVKKVVPVKRAISAKKVVPVKEVVSVENVIAVEEVVPEEEVISVEKVVPLEPSPPRKKRKRRSTSLLHTSSKLMDPPSEHPISQGDDETLAEFMKRSVSTTGRASSDNAGIKVFQRRKVKFKAVRRRTSIASSKSGDNQSSSIVMVCDDLCECEECRPNDIIAPKIASPCPTVQSPRTRSRVGMAASTSTCCEDLTMRFSETETSQLASIVSDDHPETEQLSHPDYCTGEFDSLTLPDDPPQLPVLYDPPIHESGDIEEVTEEQFRGEVAQQISSITGATARGLDFSTSAPSASLSRENSLVERDDKSFDAFNVGPGLCDSDMSEVLNAESRPKPTEETCGIGVAGQGACAFDMEFSTSERASQLNLESLNGNSHPLAEDSASVVTRMELELAEERIESILETLVTPDDLLPTHLSASVIKASKTTKKKKEKKKRRCFSESVTLDTMNIEGSYFGALPINNLKDLTEPISLDTLKSVTENVPSTVSDNTEEVALSATINVSDTVGPQMSDEAQLDSQEHGIAHGTTLIAHGIAHGIEHGIAHGIAHGTTLISEEKGTPATCSMDAEVVHLSVQEDTLVNAAECSSNGSDSLVNMNDAVDVIETPTKSTSCNEDSRIFQTPSTSLDAPERDAGASDTSTSKALFSNLKTDSLSKRNRKSFSPNSRLALIEAARSERSIPPFKIKLMKSNLSDRCSSKLFSQKMVKRKNSPPQDQKSTPGDSSAQDMMQCDVEQIQLVASSDSHSQSSPAQTTEDDSSNLSAPSPSEPPSDCNTHIVPGSPEYKKEPSVSNQSGTEPVVISTPDNSLSNLPCTGGSLLINVECHPGSPSDLKTPKTPNDRLDSSQQPKSILKTRVVDSDTEGVTCRGICKCPRCVSTHDLSETARDFITLQMKLANTVTRKLLAEMRNMRSVLEDHQKSRAEGEVSTSCDSPIEQAKGALESVSKTEDWATKQLLKLTRDSKQVCRLIETGPRRTIFADDAGRQLCHVKLLPAKKTLVKNLSA